MNRTSWVLGISVLSEYDRDGFLGFQLDAAGEAQSGLPAAEALHPYGFLSRGLDPEDTQACALLYFVQGSQHFAVPISDPRTAALLPELKKGGSIHYASDGAFASFDPETHTWTLYVPYANDKAHVVTVGKDGNGKPIVELSSGTGAAVTILENTVTINNAAGNSYIEVGPAGTNVAGTFKATSGADLGGPTSEPLAKFAANASALTAIQAALAALGGIAVNGAAGAAIAAAAAAVTAATTPAVGGTTFTKGA